MNRRGFLASLIALPAAIKAFAAESTKSNLLRVPFSEKKINSIYKHIETAAGDFQTGDLVYLNSEGKLTKLGHNYSECLGVALDKAEGQYVKYISDGHIYRGVKE